MITVRQPKYGCCGINASRFTGSRREFRSGRLRGNMPVVGDTRQLTPKEIFEIAEGNLEGNPVAAKRAFDHAGEVLGEAIASMNAVVDGIVVIGGGIIAAHKYLMPAVMRELNGTLKCTKGLRRTGWR